MSEDLPKQLALSILGEDDWKKLTPVGKLAMIRSVRWLVDAIGMENIKPSQIVKEDILSHLHDIERKVKRDNASMDEVDEWLDSRLSTLRKEWFFG